QRGDVRARQHVNGVVGDPGDVNDLIGQIGNFAAAANEGHVICRAEADIDALQEPHIANILYPALTDDRQNAQLVGVVEHGGEIIAEFAVNEAGISGHKNKGIGVHTVSDLVHIA